jgi:hypothetical protein
MRAFGEIILEVQEMVKEAFKLVELAYVHAIRKLVK